MKEADKPPPVESAARGHMHTRSHLGDEVRVLQTGKLQDWLLDPLYSSLPQSHKSPREGISRSASARGRK